MNLTPVTDITDINTYYWAMTYNNNVIVDTIIQRMINVRDPFLSTIFKRAIDNNDFDKVILLIDFVNPADVNNLAIRTAAARGYADIVQFLAMDPRVDPTARNDEAIRSAYKNRHWDVVELLKHFSPGVSF